MIIEDKEFFTEQDKKWLNENIVFCKDFPLHLNHTMLNFDNNNFLIHTIVKRRDNEKDLTKPCKFNSYLGETVVKIVKKFCDKHNIKFNYIIRSCINFCFRTREDTCAVHVDHTFPHKTMVVYLNDPDDKKSYTVMLDNDKKTVLRKIKPEAFKVVCFDEVPHYLHMPKFGYRMILVTTFN